MKTYKFINSSEGKKPRVKLFNKLEQLNTIRLELLCDKQH